MDHPPKPIAHPPSLTVNTRLNEKTNNDGWCTLRKTITAANSNADYNDCVAASVSDDSLIFIVNGTITLDLQLLNITDTAGLTIVEPTDGRRMDLQK